MSAPFATAAHLYRGKGWSPVPIPPNRKSPPPAGWTGYDGLRASGADIEAWLEDGHGVDNVGLRLNDTTLGIDVDAYGGKPGTKTLVDALTRLGSLPFTDRSSSRPEDQVSGIRFFKVPAGRRWADVLGPGVEIIHWGHRYALAWPSVHPEGRLYQWWAPDGTPLAGPPNVDDLPELPAAWVADLDRGDVNDRTVKAAVNDEAVTAFLATCEPGPPCRYVTRLLGELGEKIHGSASRHDLTRTYAAKIVRAGDQGHQGVHAAIDTAESLLLAERPLSDDAEFTRLVAGAVGLVTADPTSLFDKGCCAPPRVSPAQDGSGADLSDQTPSWAPVDVSKYLDGSYVQPVPTLLERTDGVCLLYPGLVHSLHGESESGKSLVAQHLAAQQISVGRDVLFLDFESDAGSVLGRLLMFGATPRQILDHFVYVHPEVDPRNSGAELPALNALLGRTFVLAVIDGVTDSLGVFGLATKDNDDVASWMRFLPKRIAERTGAAVTLVDHVTKDADSRGRFAIGGQAKMSSLTGAAYTVEVVEPLGRGLRGIIVLRVGKDRPGFVRGRSGPMRKGDRTQESARVVVDSTQDPDHPKVTVDPWRGSDGAPTAIHTFRLTGFMEKISGVMQASSEPMSGRGIDALVSGNKGHIADALDSLVTEGYVIRRDGANRSKMHTLERPYRQVDDPRSDRYIGPGGTESPNASNNGCPVSPVPTPGHWGHTLDRPLGTPRGHPGDTRICPCGTPLSDLRQWAGKTDCADCEVIS